MGIFSSILYYKVYLLLYYKVVNLYIIIKVFFEIKIFSYFKDNAKILQLKYFTKSCEPLLHIQL